MLKLLIVADDFTGALDTGIQFAKKGAPTLIAFGERVDFASIAPGTEVLVVNAETRHLPPAEAARAVGGITRAAAESGVDFFLKKTDSALRGNTAAEIAAMLEASGGRELMFFPAHPTIGRVTRGGTHYIDGVPVAGSVFGKDPFEPVTESYIPGMFGGCGLRAVSVPAGGMPALAEAKQVAIFDAESEDDFRKSLAACKSQGRMRALAGCAGLAAVLPEFIGFSAGERRAVKKTDGFLVVCGSLNPITLAQLDAAEKAGFARIHLTDAQKLGAGGLDGESGAALMERIKSCGSPLIIDTLSPGGMDASRAFAASEGLSPEQARARTASRLGMILRLWLDFGLDYTVLVTGGDTLTGFIKAARPQSFVPVCEIAPGAVLSHLAMGGRVVQVVSKSGGFGGEGVVVGILEELGLG